MSNDALYPRMLDDGSLMLADRSSGTALHSNQYRRIRAAFNVAALPPNGKIIRCFLFAGSYVHDSLALRFEGQEKPEQYIVRVLPFT